MKVSYFVCLVVIRIPISHLRLSGVSRATSKLPSRGSSCREASCFGQTPGRSGCVCRKKEAPGLSLEKPWGSILGAATFKADVHCLTVTLSRGRVLVPVHVRLSTVSAAVRDLCLHPPRRSSFLPPSLGNFTLLFLWAHGQVTHSVADGK